MTKQELLEQFEETVRQQEQYNSDIHHYGESDIDITSDTLDVRYKRLKQELLNVLGENNA